MCRVLNTFVVVFLLFLSISWSAAMSDRLTNTSIGNCVIGDKDLELIQVSGAAWQYCGDDHPAPENVICRNLVTRMYSGYTTCMGVPWPLSHCANDKTVIYCMVTYYWNDEGGCNGVLGHCQVTISACSGASPVDGVSQCPH